MSGGEAIDLLCDVVGVSAPPSWEAYFDIVQVWRKRTDLVAARTDTELAEILFLDAANAVRAGWITPEASLVDVGAGVGAPTIPLLLTDESLSGTLVEPRRIRTTFLRTAIGALELAKRTTALEMRLDPKNPSVDGAPFDVALSRATFAPDEWLRIGAQLAKEVWVLTAGTDVMSFKGLSLARRLDYEVPSSGAPRSILAYRR